MSGHVNLVLKFNCTLSRHWKYIYADIEIQRNHIMGMLNLHDWNQDCWNNKGIYGSTYQVH